MAIGQLTWCDTYPFEIEEYLGNTELNYVPGTDNKVYPQQFEAYNQCGGADSQGQPIFKYSILDEDDSNYLKYFSIDSSTATILIKKELPSDKLHTVKIKGTL